ncbi:MAG: fibrobacter succinogenes major paralogous domain-containing protein [Paludibacter sp.]|nr:fibrobacter succinogenes major paralogous domain-containing protein [Paludibacter sp.]
MKRILTTLYIALFTVVAMLGQDSIYVYKNGVVNQTIPTATVDSLSFSATSDSIFFTKDDIVTTKLAIADLDSISFLPPIPPGAHVDIDGNIYTTVTIGTQTWMAENLKTTRYRNGDAIPHITDNTTWGLQTAGAYSNYNNDPAKGNTYGRMYNWFAVDDSRNLAPAGWHIPNKAEWETLHNYLIANGYNYDGSTTGNKVAKALSAKSNWRSSSRAGAPGNNLSTNNSSNFNGLPGGGRYGTHGIFFSETEVAYWWVKEQTTNVEANYRGIIYENNFFQTYVTLKQAGFSVRCIKSDLPTISTGNVINIELSSAVGGGTISSDGNDLISLRGICWNTTGSPTMINDKSIVQGTTGSFSSSISGLEPGTSYYVRAFAANSVGIAYGEEVIFTTLATIPTITTTELSEITSTSAISGGNILTDGGADVTARGVCWSTSELPTVADSLTTDGAGTGEFVSTITGLNPGTTYHVRAYATNSEGTAYGEEFTFTTLDLPIVTTSPVTEITDSTAISGGEVTADGGTEILARGVCWSTSETPTIADSISTDGVGVGVFVSNLTGLEPGTNYYVRAYATNSVGTAYGEIVAFTSLSTLPTITTAYITQITDSSALSGGIITSDGGAGIMAKGLCWSVNENPTVTDSITIEGEGPNPFTSTLTDLNPGTTYYVRAYATNTVGTAYGEQLSFTTIDIPTVVTGIVTEITDSSALSGGEVTADGGAEILARGICWSTDPIPTISDSTTTDGVGLGVFVSSLTELEPGTVYYVRAYATNSAGTAYGEILQFTSPAILATVITVEATEITDTSAVSGGIIMDNGGAEIVTKGVCWSTNENPTLLDNFTTDGTGMEPFTSSLTGLTANTVYFVRSYATNSIGTVYGNQVTFTTLETPQE